MELPRSNKLLLHLIIGVVLGVIYPLQEIFTGNQNIYFLWGMAEHFPSLLGADPLLKSPDPYPLFTWLLTLVPYKFLGVWSSIIYVLLSSVYSYSLFGIADKFAPIYARPKKALGFTALFLFLHSSPIWGTYFNLFLGHDLRWLWDSGIAEQGVLRGYLQPSVFGVFFLLSMYQAMKGNYASAILSLAPAACLHGNYLFLSSLLTVGFLFHSRMNKTALIAAGVLFLAVLPYSIYILRHFLVLDSDLRVAIDLAVRSGFDENIHLNPINWLNSKFYVQLVILSLGATLVHNTRLKLIFWSILLLGVGVSIIAYATDNTTLISLNPWRLSIILIPVSSAVILAKIISWTRWTGLSSFLFTTIGLMTVGLVYFRIFGTGNSDFILNWQLVQIAIIPILFLLVWIVNKKYESKLQSVLEMATILALVVVGLVSSFIDSTTKEQKAEFIAISAVEKIKEQNTVYVIPTHWTSFRLNARKSVYVDQNLVYGPALPSLTERLNDVDNGRYESILSKIPNNQTVKLITDQIPENLNWISSETLGSNFICYTLR